jgi:hypothetical protein
MRNLFISFISLFALNSIVIPNRRTCGSSLISYIDSPYFSIIPVSLIFENFIYLGELKLPQRVESVLPNNKRNSSELIIFNTSNAVQLGIEAFFLGTMELPILSHC